MKFIIVPILLILLASQTFSKWFIFLEFSLNKNYIAAKLCENRSRPVLKCNGKCQLMKKMKQEEKGDQDQPAGFKIMTGLVLSSKTFFANLPTGTGNMDKRFPFLIKLGIPIERSTDIFHPPSV